MPITIIDGLSISVLKSLSYGNFNTDNAIMFIINA